MLCTNTCKTIYLIVLENGNVKIGVENIKTNCEKKDSMAEKISQLSFNPILQMDYPLLTNIDRICATIHAH